MFQAAITQEMISLMRGFFAMPVLSSLGRLGTLDELLSVGQFSVDDFKNVPNKKALEASFRYLARIGLLEHVDKNMDTYKASELGKQIFLRHSSYYVPHSYHEYMNGYYELLCNPSFSLTGKVDRLENIIGSGKTHQRYFFPAISFLRRKVKFGLMVDLGCGNGFFLMEVLKSLSDKKIAGVDISQLAVDVAYGNLTKQFPARDINVICSDAADIDNWGGRVLELAGKDKVVFSMWFLVHEISHSHPEIVVEFLQRIHNLFPEAPIVIGELVKQSDEILSRNRLTSIMPEYLFFHELSRQGILTWGDYQKILKEIPYQVSSERCFDELADEKGQLIPSTFVWCLKPK